VIVSALDLEYRLGCTPAWWQLLKALWKGGASLTCVPYLGAAVTSPWWTCVENPCRQLSIAFAALRNRFGFTRFTRNLESSGSNAMVDGLVAAFVRPRWRRTIVKTLETLPNTACILNLGVPPYHLDGLPSLIRERFGIPSWFYDGDMPASLPEHGGFATGFRIYDRARLAEYDGVICNSEGSLERLRALGARKASALHWGADPDFFPHHDVTPDVDVGFYGIGSRHREQWIRSMIGGPSEILASKRFCVWGGGMERASLGRSSVVESMAFSRLSSEMSRVRVHLNITRSPHATVAASSSARPFEIAAMSGAIVSNPVEGMERWFEPGRELCIVHDENEAVETYDWLLRDESARRSLGMHARQRLLEEHTYDHRATSFFELTAIGSR
jgi:hypothetical protein